MSLVIMACVDGGIVCASDSKSTYFVNGDGQKEKERDAKKVFISNNFIMGTFGINKVNNELLEDVIDKILISNPNLTGADFLTHFKDYICSVGCCSTFNYIIGEKEGSLYSCKGYIVNQSNLQWDGGYASNNGGNTYLKNKTSINLLDSFGFPPKTKISEVEKILKQIIKDTINFGDKLLTYNPVGGNIQIKSFK